MTSGSLLKGQSKICVCAIRRFTSVGLPIVHHEGYVAPLPEGHRFPMAKFAQVFKFLEQDCIIQSSKQVFKPDRCSWSTLGLVHTQEYLNGLSQLSLTDKEVRRIGLPLTNEVVSRCRYETGGTLFAAKLALKYGLACSTAGGTHHAFPSFGAGFCLLNDLAVTAQYCITNKLTERVLIVDLDVHQGDGTANIFKNDDNVFTFSMHCKKNFPFHKESSNYDVPLANGLKGSDYLNELRLNLPDILDTIKPSLVLYDAGVDPHVDDLLGKLCLTDQNLFDRDLYVLTEVHIKRKIPCASVIGGGYSTNIGELARRHTIIHRAANTVWSNNTCMPIIDKL